MARLNKPNILPKHTKKVRLGVYSVPYPNSTEIFGDIFRSYMAIKSVRRLIVWPARRITQVSKWRKK